MAKAKKQPCDELKAENSRLRAETHWLRVALTDEPADSVTVFDGHDRYTWQLFRPMGADGGIVVCKARLRDNWDHQYAVGLHFVGTLDMLAPDWEIARKARDRFRVARQAAFDNAERERGVRR